MNRKLRRIDIDQIQVKERIRQEIGLLDELKSSIEKDGLLD